MNFEWWHWAIAGIILVVSELAVPAFVLIWFGLGAMMVSIAIAIFPLTDITSQLALWLLASVVLVACWFKIFKPGQLKTRAGASDPSVIGEVGLIVRPVGSFERGEVRFQKPILGGEVWSCIADETIAVGERVRVIAVEGSLLKVGKA